MTPVLADARIPVGSRILAKLEPAEYRLLLPSLEHVLLEEGEVLVGLGDRVRHIYFPDDAVASLLFDVDGRRTVEVAMEGNEAAVGLLLHLGGVNTHGLSVVRHAGTAMRLPVGALERFAVRGSGLQELLRRSLHALVTQIARLGVCSRFHTIDARFALWLLMTRERTGTRELLATHKAIAQKLGVRRSSVTGAASKLHQASIIDYRRGRIAILDHARLGAAACPCYGTIKAQYDSFLD
ncbi:MAG TPA: Crp/Fnr family transcriptional regulator [Pseudomonadales bacterium]|nr:Crp/Fnr family transcriptional regulator [Pseudomonadales bacterium]